MGFKDKIEKFRQWQREPLDYSYSKDDVHHCQCCGEDYNGNFCPACGQRATLGRINWNSVRVGIMDLWGMGGRSLPRTLWHLLLRPGYLIGDYISGKRQVSFPPVKMLVIVALVVFLIVNWTDPTFFQDTTQGAVTDGMSAHEKSSYYFVLFFEKLQKHIDWMALLFLSFLIYPTWVTFHYAPRHDHHTLPQGFFIQVFNSTIVLIIILFLGFCDSILPSENITSTIFCIVVFLQLLRTYQQLFGYNWWSTIWRLLVVIMAGVVMIVAGVVLSGFVMFALFGDMDSSLRNGFKFILLIIVAMILLVGSHLINKRTSKRGDS